MGAQRTSFEKLQRDRAKKAKAANKREKRQGRAESEPSDEPATDADALLADDGHELTAGELLALVEELHRRYDAKEIEFEEFEERKVELLQRLPVD